MALKLTFTKVQLLQFVRKPAGGTLKVSCALTKPVMRALAWGEFPEWEKSASPHGSLSASVCEFIPAHSDLAKHAVELSTFLVRDFELLRVQVKNGKSAQKAPTFKTELHCSIDFQDENGARKLEGYMQFVPTGSMRVTYEPKAEQTGLDLEDGQGSLALDDERRRATSAAAD